MKYLLTALLTFAIAATILRNPCTCGPTCKCDKTNCICAKGK